MLHAVHTAHRLVEEKDARLRASGELRFNYYSRARQPEETVTGLQHEIQHLRNGAASPTAESTTVSNDESELEWLRSEFDEYKVTRNKQLMD